MSTNKYNLIADEEKGSKGIEGGCTFFSPRKFLISMGCVAVGDEVPDVGDGGGHGAAGAEP
jgi:hypothetical protein